MKIEKLPSGNYRALVSLGIGPDGKYHRKSVTAPTKREVQRLVEAYQGSDGSDPTIGEAVDTYVRSREAVISPATLKEYKSLSNTLKSKYGRFCALKARSLDQKTYQAFVTQRSEDGASPKTIRNNVSLIGAALKMHDITPPYIRTPRRTKPAYHIPTEHDIQRIAQAARGSDMEIPLMLAFLGLRRGEICAVRASDISGTTLHVQRTVVYDAAGQLIEKPPKTASSDRFITIPEDIAAQIQSEGRATTLSPRRISKRFQKLLDDLGIERFRFHDLRHFFVSYCHTVLRLSDAQIQALGGWSTSHVMAEFYRQTMRESEAADTVASRIAFLTR